MNQENLLNKIRQKDAKAFTHGGKFHADDIFSSALLLYLNPEIQITRGNQVPEEYDGIVFDIGRGAYDHHQKDSRRFLEKNWQKNLMNPLSSLSIRMIIPVRRMNWLR